jgi:hypothetical protein
VFTHEHGKIGPAETVLKRGEGRIKENDGGGEYD